MRQHLSQFCSTTVLAHFGAALEDFKTNGPFVNDCIMTVLHHIGADLGRADLLCDPIILRPFSKIWGEDYNVSSLHSPLMAVRSIFGGFQKKKEAR